MARRLEYQGCSIGRLLIYSADRSDWSGYGPSRRRSRLVEVVSSIEAVPTHAAAQFKQSAQLQGIHEVEPNALRLGVNDRSDITRPTERLIYIRAQQIRRGHRVDLIDCVTGSDGIRNLLPALDS